MTDVSNGEGYRITLGVVYEALQAQSRTLQALDTSVRLMDARLNTALEENTALRGRVGKLENRLNGMLLGIGSGVVTALVVYFRGVVG